MQRFFLIFIGVLYLIPAQRLVLSQLRKLFSLFVKKDFKPVGVVPDAGVVVSPLRKIALAIISAICEIEYVLTPFRFYLVGVPVTFVVSFLLITYGVTGSVSVPVPMVLSLVACSLINAFAQSHKIATNLRLVEFLRQHPRIHPQDFFTLYKRELAFGVPDLFHHTLVREIGPEDADFRAKGRPKQTSSVLFASALDTGYLNYLILTALRHVGPGYAREITDPVGCLWGKRMLERTKNQITVTGLEKLAGLNGRFLLVFNHKSSLDFVLTFFAFSDVQLGSRGVRPRFIVAKDHFKDNPILYRMLGIGMVCEAMDMVFIERKDRYKSFENLRQAACFMVDKDIDIAIYPQGTRAIGNFDRTGKRRDAGYYTTVSIKDPAKPLSHIKKGTAYLVLDTLKEMRARGMDENLHLVFVGIQGTANTLPRGSFRVQTENNVQFSVGDVVALPPHLADDILLPEEDDSTDKKLEFVDRMNSLIDAKLEDAMGLHVALKKRFLTELKGAFRFDEEKIENIASMLDLDQQKTSGTVYQIIDRVYSLPPEEWNGYLSQLCQLMQGRAEPERFLPILEDVSGKLVVA